MSLKHYASMRSDELAKATAEFDCEFVADAFAEPPPSAKTAWRNAKRKRGRPTSGEGIKVISVSLEKGLLAEADKLAKTQGVSRARLITRGLRAVLASERQKRPQVRRSV